MNALATITETDNSTESQWQFDKIMSAIAYDVDLTIVFMFAGVGQLQTNKAWKCLDLYGVNKIYYINSNYVADDFLINAEKISSNKLKELIKQADILI